MVLETERSKYRFFHKYQGRSGIARIRCVSLIGCGLRFAGYTLLRGLNRDNALDEKVKRYRFLLSWHWRLNPIRFIEQGEEPASDCPPLGAVGNVAPQAFDSDTRMKPGVPEVENRIKVN